MWPQAFPGEPGKGHGCSPPAPAAGPARRSVPLACARRCPGPWSARSRRWNASCPPVRYRPSRERRRVPAPLRLSSALSAALRHRVNPPGVQKWHLNPEPSGFHRYSPCAAAVFSARPGGALRCRLCAPHLPSPGLASIARVPLAPPLLLPVCFALEPPLLPALPFSSALQSFEGCFQGFLWFSRAVQLCCGFDIIFET